MLTITQVESLEEKEKVHEFIKQYGKASQLNDNKCILMAAKEREQLIGIGGFTLLSKYAMLKGIIVKPGYEKEQLDISIGKAMLNFIERRNIKKVYAQNDKNNIYFRRFLQALTFILLEKGHEDITLKENHEIYFLDLTYYFKKSCCKHR